MDMAALAAARAIAAGVDWVQIREKDLSVRHLLELVQRAVLLAAGSRTKIVVNSRPDIALAAHAAGMHLPAGSISPQTWRAMTPRGFLIGVSCHTIDEVAEAEASDANYVLFGPVFAPTSKASDLAPRGLAGLTAAAQAVRIPVLALGGITDANAQSCVDAGAAGVAGISMFQTC